MARRVCQLPFFLCVKPNIINAEFLEEGPCIVACTHMGYLEGACVSILIRRRINWMAGSDLFHFPIRGLFFRAFGAVPLQRHGVPVKALRDAIRAAKSGQAMGLFPEGQVSSGAKSVCRGGPIKAGVCFISMAAQVPIIPVVVVGADRLHHARAWIPFRGNRLWVILGQPLAPPPITPGLSGAATRRIQRAEMTAELQRRFMNLYADWHAMHPVDETVFS
jgi:1-acyl-sn-glycerol-3-phosphate acyltransferase